MPEARSGLRCFSNRCIANADGIRQHASELPVLFLNLVDAMV
jgi:hypothetical protein